MRKKFAVNLFFLFAANLLVKPFWILGIDRVVQNKVGPEVYGTFFAVYNYSFILSIILDFGLNNFNNRAVSRSPQRASEYIVNLIPVKLLLGLLYFVFTFLSAALTGYSELQLKMLLLLAVNQILLSGILFLRSNIAALQYFKTDSLLSVADRLLVIIFCLYLFYSTNDYDAFNIMWFIYAQTLAYLITITIAAVIVGRNVLLKFKFWKSKYTKLILLKSFPFALLALLMGIYSRLDAVMLERMLPNGAYEAGVYAASYRLLDALNQFGVLFATLLLPMFAAMIRKGDNTQHLARFGAELLFVISITTAFNGYFFRNEIMLLLYPESNPQWAQIFGLLILCFIPVSSVYIFGTLLTALGSMKTLNTIAAGGVVVNIILNCLLIPAKGAWGAALATLLTQLIVAFAHIMAVRREQRLRFEYPDTIKLFLFVISCIIILLLMQVLPMSWPIRFLISIAANISIGIALKLLPLNELLDLVKSKAA